MGIQIQIPNRLVIDFLDPAQVLGWNPVNDRVMGGVSTSQATATAEWMAFIGVVSLDNNGGFASIRALPCEYGLAGTSSLILRIKGDGQTYKFGIRTDDAFDGVQYQSRFATQSGESIPSPKFMLLLHESCRFPRLGKSSRRLKIPRHFCRANLLSAACIFAP